MKFKNFIKVGVMLTIIMLVGIMLMIMSVFALDITNYGILTNIILLLLVASQLLTINILLYIYETLKGGRRK